MIFIFQATNCEEWPAGSSPLQVEEDFWDDAILEVSDWIWFKLVITEMKAFQEITRKHLVHRQFFFGPVFSVADI